MSNSTSRQSAAKPKKPHPDFPLYPHPSGVWCKKVRGKLHYFGPWADPQAALQRWLDEKDDLLAGRVPRRNRDGLTVLKLTGEFMDTKQIMVDQGRQTERSLREYKPVCDRMCKVLGKTTLVVDLKPADFEKLLRSLPTTWNLRSRGLFIQRVRAIVNFAHNKSQQLIPAPVMFGPAFCGLTKKEHKKLKAQRGERLFSPDEIHAILGAATPAFRAAVLLGISCGLGNTDIAQLAFDHLDLDGGWLTYPRPKTGEDRRAWLWPEVVEALRAVIATRPKPADQAHRDLVFLTDDGRPWVRLERKRGTAASGLDVQTVWTDKVCATTTYVLGKLGLRQRGFYTLRRTFRTIADQTTDQVACNTIMGHTDPSMAEVYRQRKTGDDRLRRVGEYVRAWLYAPPPAAGDEAPSTIPMTRTA